jgi:hypothetical protein
MGRDLKKTLDHPNLRPSDGTEDSVETLIKKEQAEFAEQNADLEARAKTVPKLIVTLDCSVTGVYGSGRQMSVYDQRCLSDRQAGTRSYTIFTVDTKTIVSQLIMPILPPIEVGDYIRAFIYVGKEETERRTASILAKFIDEVPSQSLLKKYIVEREFEAIERPLVIQKLRDGQDVATYVNSSSINQLRSLTDQPLGIPLPPPVPTLD